MQRETGGGGTHEICGGCVWFGC